jgi:hypothetical protein
MNCTEEHRSQQLYVYSLLTIALTGIALQIIQVAQVQCRHGLQRIANTQQHFEIDISNLIVLRGGRGGYCLLREEMVLSEPRGGRRKYGEIE